MNANEVGEVFAIAAEERRLADERHAKWVRELKEKLARRIYDGVFKSRSAQDSSCEYGYINGLEVALRIVEEHENRKDPDAK